MTAYDRGVNLRIKINCYKILYSVNANKYILVLYSLSFKQADWHTVVYLSQDTISNQNHIVILSPKYFSHTHTHTHQDNHKYLLHSLFNSVYTKASPHSIISLNYAKQTTNLCQCDTARATPTCLHYLSHHLVTPNTYPYTFQIHSNVSISQDRQPNQIVILSAKTNNLNLQSTKTTKTIRDALKKGKPNSKNSIPNVSLSQDAHTKTIT
jgi:hypothetical protein